MKDVFIFSVIKIMDKKPCSTEEVKNNNIQKNKHNVGFLA